MDALTARLRADPRIAYALLFGSRARGSASEASDLDIALGFEPDARMSVQELGELAADLERDTGHAIDLVLADEAPPAVAYRIFAEGQLLVEHNHRAFVARKVRAILEYLDFAPFEALCARGVITAAARGR
ncbi:MAG: nucleotidyltransferase domain-containing protein [Gammaproteobacteria bacterium]|nr:nucleotidyltransferase domain-containing protein [Gammaproteobacteria bacterium]